MSELRGQAGLTGTLREATENPRVGGSIPSLATSISQRFMVSGNELSLNQVLAPLGWLSSHFGLFWGGWDNRGIAGPEPTQLPISSFRLILLRSRR